MAPYYPMRHLRVSTNKLPNARTSSELLMKTSQTSDKPPTSSEIPHSKPSSKMDATSSSNRRGAVVSFRLNYGSSRLARLAACCLAAAVLLALAAGPAVECQEQLLTVESRQAKEQAASENELADTIKYLEKLEKLDKYWSEVARPRFGRSEYKQPALFAAARSDPLARPASARVIKAMNSEPRVGSLIELINSRLAQRYNSDEAY